MLFLSYCSDLWPIISLIKKIITIVEIGIPIILILLGVFDLGKAVTAAKEDEIKSAQKLLFKRVIYAVAIFFVVLLVRVIFGAIVTNTNGVKNVDSWTQCWDCGEIVIDKADGLPRCASEGQG